LLKKEMRLEMRHHFCLFINEKQKWGGNYLILNLLIELMKNTIIMRGVS
jgi:hypothetical protein